MCVQTRIVTGDDEKQPILWPLVMNTMNMESFQALDANPGGTLQRFKDYIDRIELLFTFAFRNPADGTAFAPTDAEKKAMLLFKGGKDMKNLFNHVGKVLTTDSYEQTKTKIRDALTGRTNQVVQRNMLLSNHPQGSKTFEKWSQEIANSAQLIDYTNYDWKQATVDAICLQTANPKLRERALQDNTSYDDLMTLGITKEQSAKGAALLERASGQSSGSKSTSVVKMEEEVRRLKIQNKQMQSKNRTSKPCGKCGKSIFSMFSTYLDQYKRYFLAFQRGGNLDP